MDKVDRGLQTGNHLQGYLSGLFHIMESQRNAIVMTRMNQLFKGLTGRGEAISAERLRDMGFKPEDMSMLTKYAHAAVWHDNKLIRTGIDQWTPEHQQYIMMRVQSEINNLIQQVSIGEGNVLGQRNALFGIMLQLKSFVMAASNKQFYRNIRIGDKQTQMSMLWGTVMGSLMFEVKSLINGDTENLTPLKAVKGGFGMSNMTGWMPMWTDPIAGILGLDNLGVGTDSRGQGHILKPAAYSVLSGLSEIPGLPMDAMTGNLTPSELRNLSYLPLGRMYGVPLMRNEFSNLVLK
jgi:hypothetical protein